MTVPFFAISWYVAIALALGTSFLNPTMFLVNRNKMAQIYGVLPLLNIVAVSGAVYFAVRVMALLSRGYGAL